MSRHYHAHIVMVITDVTAGFTLGTTTVEVDFDDDSDPRHLLGRHALEAAAEVARDTERFLQE